MGSSMAGGQQPPQVGEAQIELLERLCNACGVSGDEREVRAIVLEQVRQILDGSPGEYRVDALGNVLVTRPGRGENRLRVMLAAHMDEVGFMLISDEGDGTYRFDLVGGIDPRQLPGKPVWMGREHIPGVIGVRPIHLTKPEERRQAVSLDSLRIDLGPGNGGSAKIGERAYFASSFRRLGDSLRAKAMDDRLGVAILLELLRHAPPNIDLLAAFTVQEEVGLRGARVAAFALNPDLAIALDCTPANDLPVLDWDAYGSDSYRPENTRYNTRLGYGPAIYIADRATISDPRLVRHLVDTAQSAGIPFQFRQPGGGGTDAGAIHQQRAGIPSISVSVPVRYPHTQASLVRLSDWQNTLALVYLALAGLPADLLQPER